MHRRRTIGTTMKIKVKDIVDDFRKDALESTKEIWISREIMRSISPIISGILPSSTSTRDIELDIGLVINGREVEPLLLGDILRNLASHVDREAERLTKERLKELDMKYSEFFSDAVELIKEKVGEELNLSIDNN